MNILDIAIAKKLAGGGGGSGTDNYNDLSNLPKINDTTLSGNKSSSALGLQSEINSDSKLASDLVDDTNQDNKFVTSTEKNTWNAKQNAIDSDHKLSSDLVDDANHTNKFVTSTEKQTWNAKQNAIDADHKLSSSLVSFSEAEAAAIASGIDSSKVGQISTNQSNILLVEKSNPVCNELHYNVEDLKKINSSDYSWSYNVASLSGIKFTINEDNSISWVATNLANTVWLKLYDSAEMPAIASGEYVLHGCPSGGGISTYELEAVVGGSDKKEYGDSTSFTVSNNLTLVAIGIRAGSSSGTFYPVLINKSLYDAGITDYVAPALPNYDLTRLEAEDRASLAEVVDSGVKNLMHNIEIVDNDTSHGVTYTLNSDGTITVNGTPEASADSYVVLRCADENIFNWLDGKHVLSGCPVGGSFENGYSMYLGMASYLRVDDGSGVVMDAPTESISYVNLVIRVKKGTTANNLVFKPMICNKVAWDISNAFVSYRSAPKLSAPALRTSLVTRGSLDDITTSTYALYRPEVTGKPEANKYVFCRTDVFDSTFAIQHLTYASDPFGKSYVRVKSDGTWRSWLQTTNT